MQPQPNPRLSIDDYLAGEAESRVRHEYVDGVAYAMGGARDAHVTIALNVASFLREKLRGSGCRVYMADMKVHHVEQERFFYPDVFVTCDPADHGRPLYKCAPKVIIEVLSASTAAYDRGQKFAYYRAFASLETYLLIESEGRAVDLYQRSALAGDVTPGWMLRPYDGDDVITLAPLHLQLPLATVYEDVTLPAR
ncbi:MAG: Uma2 family endonuclease [Polyangiales bacterium]